MTFAAERIRRDCRRRAITGTLDIHVALAEGCGDPRGRARTGLTLAACGGSGYEYVSNDEAGIFFKVPDDWSVIDVDTDDGTLGRPGVPLDWARVVDSSPCRP